MTLKKEELTGRQSHAVHKDKQLIPCSQSTGGKKMHFTDLLHILCHTQQLSLRLFRTLLKTSSSFFKSKT